MPNPWPCASLLLVMLFFWYERRLLGGSATLPFSGFRQAFTASCVAAPLCALLLQRLSLVFVSPETMSWSLGPVIEECAKAAPVLILIFAYGAERYLTIADMTLLGLASGLGFSFVEQNLRVLASNWHKLGPLQFRYLFEFGFDAHNWKWGYSFSGHATAAGVVVLVAALCARFSKRPVYSWIFVAVALAVVSFDHGLNNWKVEHTDSFFGEIQSVDQAPPAIEHIYLLTLHGLVETLFLPLGLLLGSWAEGVRFRKATEQRPDLLLPGESRPLVLSEWLIALSRLKLGRFPFFQTLAYFRRRRAYALLRTESEHAPELITPARRIEAVLLEDHPRIVDPPPSDWIPPRNLWLRMVADWLKRFRWVLVARVLVIVIFMLGPWLPGNLAPVIYGTYFPLFLAAFGLLMLWPSLRTFTKQPKFDPARATGEALSTRYFGALLLGSSVVSALVGVVNIFLRGHLIGGHSIANITDAIGGWGGNPGTLAALAPFVAADPARKPPCDDLRKEVQKGDQRIQELQRERAAAGWDGVLNAPAPGPPGAKPIEEGGTFPLPPSFDDKHLDEAAAKWAREHGLIQEGGQATGGAAGDERIPASGGRRPHRDPQEKLDALGQQIAAEQKAQAARAGALADCEKRAAPPPLTKADIGDLQKQVDAAKRQFEELERQLQDAVNKDMQGIQDFLQGYDDILKRAVNAANDYLQNYKALLPDYQKIVEQFVSRADALKKAEALDQVAQILAMFAGDFLPAAAEGAGASKALSGLGAGARETEALSGLSAGARETEALSGLGAGARGTEKAMSGLEGAGVRAGTDEALVGEKAAASAKTEGALAGERTAGESVSGEQTLANKPTSASTVERPAQVSEPTAGSAGSGSSQASASQPEARSVHPFEARHDTYGAPGEYGYYDHYEFKFPGDSKAIIQMEKPEDGGAIIEYIERGSQPKGSGGQMIADAVREAGIDQPKNLIFHNVINEPTLEALANGAPIEQTVLGRTMTSAAEKLGARVQNMRLETDGLGKISIRGELVY